MRRPRKTIASQDMRAKLDEAIHALRDAAGASELDPFDEAMMAAIEGLARAMGEMSGAVEEAEGKVVKLARRR